MIQCFKPIDLKRFADNNKEETEIGLLFKVRFLSLCVCYLFPRDRDFEGPFILIAAVNSIQKMR